MTLTRLAGHAIVWLSLALATCGGSSIKTVSDGEAGGATTGGNGGTALTLTIRYYTDAFCSTSLLAQPSVTLTVAVRD
jgi:hypothetical protein